MLTKIITPILIACHFLAYCTESDKYTIIKDEAALPILSPCFANQKTMKIRLENGLEALIISDPKVDKSSAVLAVKTGSWEDPQEYPGIAHFLEHMLFLGTEKYPDESEYSHFITEHGGSTNAFTSSDITSYIFSVDNNAFSQAIDRFANFFIAPLFNPSGVDRELQAIDQEYAKNLESDDIREYYVMKELATPSHPNHGFSMGNRASLLKVSQNTLKKWYQEHYSANRMVLEVISNMPIDELKNLVVDTFSQIPNFNYPPMHVDIPLFPQELKGHMVYIKPVKNIRRLSLTWELPSSFVEMRDSKPEAIVGYVLGHEGNNSLLDDLKKEKWADKLSSGGGKVGCCNFQFNIEIVLTDAGIKNIDKVILKCFQAIANFKQKDTPHYIFDDLQKMSRTDYQYQSRQDAFTHILEEAMRIGYEPLKTYPAQTLLIQRFDPKNVEELLSYLTPQNCVFDLIAPEASTGMAFDKQEKWLNVSYAVKAIPKETLDQWSRAKPIPSIDLPEQNPFLPEHLILINRVESGTQKELSVIPTPNTIIDNRTAKIYFAQDSIYLVPKVFWTFDIKTPAIDVSIPESMVFADLYVKDLIEVLNVYTYTAGVAGLDFNIGNSDNGLTITINGYSEKAELLFIDLIKELKSFHPKESQFKKLKELLQREYQNNTLEKPLVQAYELFKDAVYKNYVIDRRKIPILKKITFKNYEAFVDTLFVKTYTQGVMYGNMSEEKAKNISAKLIATLDSPPYPKKERLQKGVAILPDNQGPFILEAKTKAQGNAAILAIEMVPFSFQSRAAQQILMQAMRDAFFATLRTKQQTGYIVMSKAEEFELHLFNVFAVQSNTHACTDLIARFELFIEQFIQELSKTQLTQESFDNIKNTLLAELKQPPKGISEMGLLLNRIAFNFNGDFEWIAKRIKAMERLSYDDFLEITKKTMGKQNKRRLGVVLSGIMPDEDVLKYTKVNNSDKIHKLSEYTSANEIILDTAKQ